MSDVLITGGFGFLGSHLTELLLKEGDDNVHVVDNLSTSPLPLEELLSQLPAGRLSYEIADLSSALENLSRSQPRIIYHTASLVGPAAILAHAGFIAFHILSDALAVAGLAMRTGSRLVYVSSSEVYGGGVNGLCSETMPVRIAGPSTARSEYALGKLAAEVALTNLHRAKGLDLCIVRPFNVAGPRQSGTGGFVLPRFAGQALASLPLTVFGDGTQRRAFTDVRDIAAGLRQIAARGETGEVYNLGNPDNACTILELAQEVREVTRTSSSISFVDPRQIYGPLYAEANDKFPDTAKSRGIGWRPVRNRMQIIEDTVGLMRSAPPATRRRLQGF